MEQFLYFLVNHQNIYLYVVIFIITCSEIVMNVYRCSNVYPKGDFQFKIDVTTARHWADRSGNYEGCWSRLLIYCYYIHNILLIKNILICVFIVSCLLMLLIFVYFAIVGEKNSFLHRILNAQNIYILFIPKLWALNLKYYNCKTRILIIINM